MKLFTINKISKKRILFLMSVLILAFIFYSAFRPFNIEGDSMSPSYESRETIWTSKIAYDFSAPGKFDVVVFYDIIFEEILIKRVIGIESDSIEVKKGKIYINDIKLMDEFSHNLITAQAFDENNQPLITWDTGDFLYLPVDEEWIIVPKDHVWVIGDNRGVSWYGLVHVDEIIGKVID